MNFWRTNFETRDIHNFDVFAFSQREILIGSTGVPTWSNQKFGEHMRNEY